jgi:putative RecB family exonuclease
VGRRIGVIYSHSRLSSFEDCPRKFQYRYVLRIPAETESIEAFVGKRVHEVLERLHLAARRRQVPSLPRVVERYAQLFDDAYDPGRVRIVRDEHPLSFYRDLGQDCLANYYRGHYPFDRDETLGLEERVLFDLGEVAGTAVRFQGIIDRIARAPDGAIEIQDYKTSARIPSQARLDEDRQLALYQIGLSRRFGPESEIRLVWHFVRQGQLRTSRRTPEQLAGLRERTLELVDRIRFATEYPHRPSPLCRWCEYGHRCAASPQRRADLPTWEEAPPASKRAAARSPRPKPSEGVAPPPEDGDAAQLALPLGAIPDASG